MRIIDASRKKDVYFFNDYPLDCNDFAVEKQMCVRVDLKLDSCHG